MKEFTEKLGKGIKLICSDTHGFGTDAILLAHFANPKPKDRCVDLGTGCGIIPFLWLRANPKNEIIGVDIQEQAIDQFNRSKELNNKDNIRGITHDLRTIEEVLPKGQFDLVTMNPPYKPKGSGIPSEATPDLIARHEVMCTAEDAAEAAEKLLNSGGRFCMCNRPERLADVITAFKNHNIEPKKIRFVQKNKDTAPWLFLIEGKKGSKPYLEVLPPLLTHDEDGNESEELLKILGAYREENQ
ncbi:MAG: methyltransferase [Clostridia bacterium]|nr:methyltransferase [Clostridia bacterium]